MIYYDNSSEEKENISMTQSSKDDIFEKWESILNNT
jgi:hypothetical protein